jgi:hypothetical protein
MITIDGINVTAAVAGTINIQHNKNMISTFSFTLKDEYYSPLTNANIRANKEVVIICYLNGYEIKLFTGLIDDISVDYTLDNFSININGSDYGKKLRNKRMSLISVQNSAVNKYRGSLIKYMAEQAGVTNVDVPEGSYTRIDHSFEDQSILDMISKELIIDSYWWRFDEDGILKIQLDEIKTDTIIYPTADWTYGENRAMKYGFTGSDENIINRVKILGTVYETAIEVDNAEDSPYNQYTDPSIGLVDNNLYTVSKDLSLAENILTWTETGGAFELMVHDGILMSYGAFDQVHYWGGEDKYYYYTIDVTFEDDISIDNYFCECTGGISFYSKYYATGGLFRFVVKRYLDVSNQELAGTIKIQINGKWLNSQPPPDPEEDVPTSAIIDNEEVEAPTYEYSYDQVAVEVIDNNSIAKYGERKPNTEGTMEFPLAENKDQCEGIGRKIIKDSHRYIKQPDFIVPFNPLLKVGQTIALSDKKIGYSERWYVEEVIHTIEGTKARTQVGCVYYA